MENNDGISMFGTTAYHAVWENVCAEVFDNKLKTSLGKLNMSVPLSKEYTPIVSFWVVWHLKVRTCKKEIL